MTKARAKTNAIRNAGQKTPGGVATRIQRPPTTEPHQKNLCRNTKPSAGSPVRETAEGLDYRFLRSQPVSSASDYSAGRDPGRATTTLTRN
jgi:hypothetical protein